MCHFLEKFKYDYYNVITFFSFVSFACIPAFLLPFSAEIDLNITQVVEFMQSPLFPKYIIVSIFIEQTDS